MEAENVMHFNFREEYLFKISEILRSSFESQISIIVANVVEGVLTGLNSNIEGLENENKVLQTNVLDLEKKPDKANDRQDKADQYSRRNNLRLSGITEKVDESFDQVVINLANDIGSDLALEEIDRTHRLGKLRTTLTVKVASGSNDDDKTKSTLKPRDIIVKFTSYRARSKLLRLKSQLKNVGYYGVFLNRILHKHVVNYSFRPVYWLRTN